MDEINVSYTLSKEDVIGVLKTIILFLESLQFEQASIALQSECTSKGFAALQAVPAKIIVVRSSAKAPGEETTKVTQTDFPLEGKSSYVLASSVHEMDDDTDEPCDGECDLIHLDEELECLVHNDFSENSEKIVIEKSLVDQDPTPPPDNKALKPPMQGNCLPGRTCEMESQELRRQLRELQTEHRRLTEITTQLTKALQSHILGNSDNASSKLEDNASSKLENYACISPAPLDDTQTKEEAKEASTSGKHADDSGKASNRSDVQDEDTNESSVVKNNSPVSLIIANNDIILTPNEKEVNAEEAIIFQVDQRKETECLVESVLLHLKQLVDEAISSSSDVLKPRPLSCDAVVTKSTSFTLTKKCCKSCDDLNVIFKNDLDNVSIKQAPDNQEPDEKEINISEESISTEQTSAVGDIVKKTPSVTSAVKDQKPDDKTQKDNPTIVITIDKDPLQTGRKPKPAYGKNRKGYFDLDYRKLKKHFLNGEDCLKVALLQALRWRITQTPQDIRDQVISSYIRHDLLGLHSSPSNDYGQSIMEAFLCPTSENGHILQEGMARLVNTFACLTLGRDYLCQDDDLLISLLVPVVTGTHHSKTSINDVTRDMLIATLQKLSIRSHQRKRMISAGLVQYLTAFLATNYNELSEYCTEYTTALFMNLCLHPEAIEILRSSPVEVVKLLGDLLNVKHQSCMPYINGAMYSLLSNAEINAEAKRVDFKTLIAGKIESSADDIQKQLEFILNIHLETDGAIDCGCEPTAEPEDEYDLVEIELDSNDVINANPEGEELLENYKLLFSVYGAYVNADHQKCICRPTSIARSVTTFTKVDEAVVKYAESDKNVQVSENEILKETLGYTGKNKTSRTKPKKELYSQLKTIKTDSTKPQEGQSKIHKEDAIKPSRSPSPMSYSEDTKKLYHTPTAKGGIFEPEKKYNKVPPSFTRTIPMQARANNKNAGCPHCNNPCCPAYAKSTSYKTAENSSIRNPPIAIDCPNFYPACYRENFIDQYAHYVAKDDALRNCRNRHTCNCYNIIKMSIESEEEAATRDENKNSQQDSKRIFYCRQPFNASSPLNNDQQATDFAYDQLLRTIRAGEDHVCPNPEIECRCYDVVFQSRPRILRTPP